jgi:uncharacterized protein
VGCRQVVIVRGSISPARLAVPYTVLSLPANRRGGYRVWGVQENEMRLIGLGMLALVMVVPEGAWALANPASVFCAQSGGKSEIRKGPRGQYGMCRLPDGRVVNEWDYFRKMHRR